METHDNLKRRKKIFTPVISFLFVFMFGALSSMTYLIHMRSQVAKKLESSIKNEVEYEQVISLFGVKVSEYSVTYDGATGLDVWVYNTRWYNYIPFICGVVLCLIVIIIYYLIKSLLKNIAEI